MSWLDVVIPGDKLRPDPEWNRTEPHRKLADPTVVVAVDRDRQCQTGTMLLVSVGGGAAWLDAGWFMGPAGK